MEERMMNASLNRRKSLETSQFFLASSRATHSPRLKGAVSKMQRYSALKSSLTEDALSTLKFEVEYKRRKLETEKYQRILDMRSIGDDESLLEEKAAAYLQHLSWLESDVSRYFVVRRPIPPPMPDLNIQPPEKAHVLFVSGRTKGKAGNAVASELQGPPLTLMYESVRRLDGSTWLNDEVINFYYRLIAKRALDSGGSLPRLHVFTTYFYIKLMTNGKFNYSAVSSWTRKINLFDLEMIFVPIHRGNHWCTSMIDMKNKQICYYDSLFGGRKNLEVPKNLLMYLCHEHKSKKGSDLDENEWTLLDMSDQIPQQENMNDCGVFACKFVERLSIRQPLAFHAGQMPDIRQNMKYEILKTQLLNNPDMIP